MLAAESHSRFQLAIVSVRGDHGDGPGGVLADAAAALDARFGKVGVSLPAAVGRAAGADCADSQATTTAPVAINTRHVGTSERIGRKHMVAV